MKTALIPMVPGEVGTYLFYCMAALLLLAIALFVNALYHDRHLNAKIYGCWYKAVQIAWFFIICVPAAVALWMLIEILAFKSTITRWLIMLLAYAIVIYASYKNSVLIHPDAEDY